MENYLLRILFLLEVICLFQIRKRLCFMFYM